MKFIHLSDLHIGLKLINHDLLNDQEYILNEIVGIIVKEQPDAVVIAGDIYDKAVPSAEAVVLFNKFMDSMIKGTPNAVIMAISGNHDSAPRIDAYRNILEKQNLYMIGTPPQNPGESIQKVVLTDGYGKVNFYLLPFVKPSMVKEITGTDENDNNYSYNEALHRLIGMENINRDERNVLVSHQFYLPAGKTPDEIERMDSEICTVGNVDAVYSDALEPFDYAALGHIHKPMKVGCDVFRYCGTPMAYSVDEAQQDKGVVVVEMGDKGNIDVHVVPLLPLHRVKIIKGDLEEVLKSGCDDYVRVVLTDKADLDVIDMQERIRSVFPNLLEIKRENIHGAEYSGKISLEKKLNPFELCCEFLGETGDEDKELLKDVINTVKGAM